MSWRKICGRKWSFRWVIFTKIWECFRKRDLSKLSSVNHLKILIMRTDTVIVRLRSGEVGCFSWHTRYLKFCGLSHTILCSLGPPFLKFNVEEIWSVTRISGNGNDPSRNILTWFLQHSCLSAELSLRSGDPHATLSTPSAHCPSENHKSLSSWTETFRSKITNYSDFRNGKVLSRDQCLGRCSV